MIEVLRAENADLMTDLGVTGSKHNEDKDKFLTAKMEELIQKQSMLCN